MLRQLEQTGAEKIAGAVAGVRTGADAGTTETDAGEVKEGTGVRAEAEILTVEPI